MESILKVRDIPVIEPLKKLEPSSLVLSCLEESIALSCPGAPPSIEF